MNNKKTIVINGAQVIIEHIDNVQTATACILVKVGSQNETLSQNGLAHVVEHMVFKGTTTRSNIEIINDMEDLGGSMNAYTSRDSTVYHTKMLGGNMPGGLDILFDIVLHPLFEEKALKSEISVIEEEIKYYEETPEEMAKDGIYSLLYSQYSIGMPICGTIETINKFTSKDLFDFHNKYYTPSNMIISIAGNIDIARILSIIEKQLPYNTFSMLNEELIVVSNPTYGINRRKADTTQSHVVIGYNAFPITDYRKSALSLRCNIMSKRLHQTIREEQGLVYSICVDVDLSNTHGMFTVYFCSDINKEEEVLHSALKDMQNLHFNPITDHELKRAKTIISTSIASNQEQTRSVCFSNAYDMFYYHKPVDIAEKLFMLQKITLEDIAALNDLFTQYSIMKCGGNKYTLYA